MAIDTLKIDKFHLKANASFSIREGWLTKGLRHVQSNPEVFLSEDATDTLGVGSAMVKSIRYWMQVAGLSKEPKAGRRIQTLTDFGRLVFEEDLYFEDYFSLYLAHYHMVTNPEQATVLYLLFNHFEALRFTKIVMINSLLQVFSEAVSKEYSESSFKDDCATALKTYVADSTKQASPEENMQSPFATLDLFTITSKGAYERTCPPQLKLHPQAVLYVILDQMNGRDAISIDKLLTEPCNVGRVFNLTPYRLNMYLDALQSSGQLSIQRTAGLNMVYPAPGQTAMNVAQQYYRR